MTSWCDHPASKAICTYGLPAARVYCAYCGEGQGGFTAFESGADESRLPYNPELEEDPDNRPYIWDLPEGDCKCH